MTSILAAQHVTFPTNDIMVQMDGSGSPLIDPSLQRRPKMDAAAESKDRGRRRSRVANNKKEGTEESSPIEPDGEGELEEDGGDGQSSGTEGPSRKRRRSRKGLDKKFECPQEGCGKSYSRAEHL